MDHLSPTESDIVRVHVVPFEPGLPWIEIVTADGHHHIRALQEGDTPLLQRFAGSRVLPIAIDDA
jgi:hypothetical protein